MPGRTPCVPTGPRSGTSSTSRAENFTRYIGGGTGLYDTTLAAYRKGLDTYDPNYSNSIIVLTDGRNDDPDSLTLDELSRRIRGLADPARPVEIVTIGISDDVDTDALKQISALSPGGTSYVARDPGDIANVLVNAVAARVTAAGRRPGRGARTSPPSHPSGSHSVANTVCDARGM